MCNLCKVCCKLCKPVTHFCATCVTLAYNFRTLLVRVCASCVQLRTRELLRACARTGGLCSDPLRRCCACGKFLARARLFFMLLLCSFISILLSDHKLAVRRPHYAFTQLVHKLCKPEQDYAHMHLTVLCNLHKCTLQFCATYINLIPFYASCRRCPSSARAHPPLFRFTHLVYNLYTTCIKRNPASCVQLMQTMIWAHFTGLHNLYTSYAKTRWSKLVDWPFA